ncbi:hypothetical protein ABE501_08430 [Comamonas testosteroni]
MHIEFMHQYGQVQMINARYAAIKTYRNGRRHASKLSHARDWHGRGKYRVEKMSNLLPISPFAPAITTRISTAEKALNARCAHAV